MKPRISTAELLRDVTFLDEDWGWGATQRSPRRLDDRTSSQDSFPTLDEAEMERLWGPPPLAAEAATAALAVLDGSQGRSPPAASPGPSPERSQTSVLSVLPAWHHTTTTYPKRRLGPTPEDVRTWNQQHRGAFSKPLVPPSLVRPLLTSAAARATLADRVIALATQVPDKDPELEVPATPVSMPKTVAPFCLSREQQHVILLARQGLLLFYTGSAGTGKLILLKQLIKSLRSQHTGEGEVVVTALTGLAAVNVGGSTLHSFAGIGLGQHDLALLVRKVRRNRRTALKWRQAKVLVVDEVLMIDGDLMEKLNHIAKKIRRSSKPFGGIQLILCGDFYQLPPVLKDPDNPARFAFELDMWAECVQHTIVLQEVFRQRGDVDFVEMLNEMRRGELLKRTETRFQSLARPLRTDDGIEPAELFPTRSEVDRANFARLRKLPGDFVEMASTDGGTLGKEERDKILLNFLAPEMLTLKVHAQVMLIKNLDDLLINGSLGRVVAFVDNETYMAGKQVEEAVHTGCLQDLEQEIQRKADKLQVPETDDPLNLSVFDFLNTLDTLQCSQEAVQLFERQKELIRRIHARPQKVLLPLVRFLCVDGTTRDVLLEQEEWLYEDENGAKLVLRHQIPLILAWLLLIHKAQGQTIHKLKVDLKRTFEKGQAYVALSRAVARTGLQVLNFSAAKVMAHEKVTAFYKTLESAGDVVEAHDRKRGGDIMSAVAKRRM